ncbi:MAG: thiamine phosphate synthase [Acidimicrobiales bacterium]
MNLGDRRLYLCTGDRPDLSEFIAACVRGGVDVVQLREKALFDGELISRARIARETCGELGVPFVLNDRPDLLAETDADGVHVGQDDMTVEKARTVIGENRMLGLSTHDPEQLEQALGEPVDYISAGPVVPTPTKPGRPGTGLGYVSEASRRCGSQQPPMPLFVTGDARPATVEAMVGAGARRIVVVRWLTESDEPERSAREIREALDRAIERAGRSAGR